MLRAAITVAVLAATTTPAWPCFNGVMLEGDQAVRAIAEAEALIASGQNVAARELLGNDESVAWLNTAVLGRVRDARVVVALRLAPRQAAKPAIDYFLARSRAQPKNLRYRALLAEAYATLNKREEALAILSDLQQRDLMPDGFAYVTLAKLSDGPDVEKWLEVCRTRAKTKGICTIPTAARAPAKKVRSSKRMRLPG